MGSFFDENPDLVDGGSVEGGEYVGKEEKKALIASGQPFTVVSAEYEEGKGYEGANRWLLVILLEDEDGVEQERKLGFNDGVESRERFIERLAAWIEDEDNEPAVVKLTKVGRSQLLVSVDSGLGDDEEEEDEAPAKKPAAKPRAKATTASARGKRASK